MSDYAHLSDEELDAAVAEQVMGWTKVVVNEYARENDPALALMPRPCFWVTEFGVNHCRTKEYWEAKRWRPSSDMNAAMEVVEKMRDRGWFGEMCADSDPDDPWYASFHQRGHNNQVSIWGKSLPRAICEAALSATEKS